MEQRENMQDSILNSNINMNIQTTQIISNDSQIENGKKENIENKENDEESSINIEGHDLDKYFEKERVNKKDPKLEEVSYSLKTINLENEACK